MIFFEEYDWQTGIYYSTLLSKNNSYNYSRYVRDNKYITNIEFELPRYSDFIINLIKTGEIDLLTHYAINNKMNGSNRIINYCLIRDS